jgi:acetyl-CoA carboxylase biotin carboxyl carrier protein
MSLSENDVLQIIRLIEESDFESLQLEYGDIKLAVSKTDGIVPNISQAPVVAEASGFQSPMIKTSPQEQVQQPTSDQVVATKQPTVAQSSNWVAVKAPIVGVFYAAPEPGAEAFIKVGDKVGSDTTVGLIEVMKIFNAVPAGIKGKVVEVCVEDSELVEFGQPLFMVEPDEGAR